MGSDPAPWIRHRSCSNVELFLVRALAHTPNISSIRLPHDHIPFQQLLQSPPLGSGSDVLHVQPGPQAVEPESRWDDCPRCLRHSQHRNRVTRSQDSGRT